MDIKNIQEPLNAQERYAYETIVRLNILIEQVSSLLQHIATKEGVATEKTTVVEKKPRTRKTVKKEDE